MLERGVGAIEYVGKLPDSAQWLLEYDGTDDAIVTGMAAVGRVFKLDGVTGAEGRAFVSTVEFPPQFVEWVHKSDRVDVSKPLAARTWWRETNCVVARGLRSRSNL